MAKENYYTLTDPEGNTREVSKTRGDAYSAGANELAEGWSLTPIKQANNTIDTDQLESDTSDPVLPEAKQQERFTTGTEESPELIEARRETKSARSDVEQAYEDLGKLGEYESDLEDEYDVYGKRKAKTAIDNEIRAKERAFDLEIRQAEDTFGTRAQKQAIKNEIIKNNNRELADLSIIQMARAGEYNDARATVDRKVELMLQDKRFKLEALTFTYQENKERFTTLEQRAFEKQIRQEERAYQKAFAKEQQLEQMKLNMLINATEAGAGNEELKRIQNVQNETELLSVPNASVYMKSKADRLNEKLQALNIQKAGIDITQANLGLETTELNNAILAIEKDKLTNPEKYASEGLTPEVKEYLADLSATERTALTDANDTVRSFERLKVLIDTKDWADLATVATEAGREFDRLARDVADKMARERTGAVVTEAEQKQFKKILGLGLINRTISDKQEVLDTIDRQLMKHNEAQNLVDPTGEIRQFLNNVSGTNLGMSTEGYLDEVTKELENPYEVYTIEQEGIGTVQTPTF